MKKLTAKSFTNYVKAAKIEMLIIVIAIFVDQLSKILVAHYMVEYQNIVLIKNFLNIHYVINYAAGFSFDFGLTKILGQEGLRWFFIIFVTLSTSVFAFFMVRGVRANKMYRVSLALIVAGAIGNLLDRIFIHGVRDFIMIEYFGKTILGNPYFPIFNVADSALTAGVILFIVYFLFHYSKDEKAKEQARAESAASDKQGGDN